MAEGSSRSTSVEESLDRSQETDQQNVAEYSPKRRYIRFNDLISQSKNSIQSSYRAFDTKNGIEIVWHIINLNSLDESEQISVTKCLNIVKKIANKYIIEYQSNWFKMESRSLNIITTHLEPLKEFISKVKTLRWRIVKKWAKQILRGLDCLHTSVPQIVHRNLSLSHIYINGGTSHTNIGDLWMASVITEDDSTPLGLSNAMTSAAYVAPESSLTTKLDIYSFGMCVLEMITREKPYTEYKGSSYEEILEKSRNGILPLALHNMNHSVAKEFIQSCLQSLDRRPSASELLQHPFIVIGSNDEEIIVPALISLPVSQSAAPCNFDSVNPSPVYSEVSSASARLRSFSTYSQTDKMNPADGRASDCSLQSGYLVPTYLVSSHTHNSTSSSKDLNQITRDGLLPINSFDIINSEQQREINSLSVPPAVMIARINSHDSHNKLNKELADFEDGENVDMDRGVHDGRRFIDDEGNVQEDDSNDNIVVSPSSSSTNTDKQQSTLNTQAPYITATTGHENHKVLDNTTVVPAENSNRNSGNSNTLKTNSLAKDVQSPTNVSSKLESTTMNSIPNHVTTIQTNITASKNASNSASPSASRPQQSAQQNQQSANQLHNRDHINSNTNPKSNPNQNNNIDNSKANANVNQNSLAKKELKLQIKIPSHKTKDGKADQQIEFAFDVLNENVEEVAKEMVDELEVRMSVEELARRIDSAIKYVMTGAVNPDGRTSSSNNVTPKKGDNPDSSSSSSHSSPRNRADSTPVLPSQIYAAPTQNNRPQSLKMPSLSASAHNSNNMHALPTNNTNNSMNFCNDHIHTNPNTAVSMSSQQAQSSTDSLRSSTLRTATATVTSGMGAVGVAHQNHSNKVDNVSVMGAQTQTSLKIPSMNVSNNGLMNSSNGISHSKTSNNNNHSSRTNSTAGVSLPAEGSSNQQHALYHLNKPSSTHTSSNNLSIANSNNANLLSANISNSNSSKNGNSPKQLKKTIIPTVTDLLLPPVSPASSINYANRKQDIITAANTSTRQVATTTATTSVINSSSSSAATNTSSTSPHIKVSTTSNITNKVSSENSTNQYPVNDCIANINESLVNSTSSNKSLLSASAGLNGSAKSKSATPPVLSANTSNESLAFMTQPQAQLPPLPPTNTTHSMTANSAYPINKPSKAPQKQTDHQSLPISLSHLQMSINSSRHSQNVAINEISEEEETALHNELEKNEKESRAARRAFEQRIQKHKGIMQVLEEDMLKLEADHNIKLTDLGKKEENILRKKEEEILKVQVEFNNKLKILKERFNRNPGEVLPPSRSQKSSHHTTNKESRN